MATTLIQKINLADVKPKTDLRAELNKKLGRLEALKGLGRAVSAKVSGLMRRTTNWLL